MELGAWGYTLPAPVRYGALCTAWLQPVHGMSVVAHRCSTAIDRPIVIHLLH